MAVSLDTSDALRVLVGWVAGVVLLSVERAGGNEAHCREKCECLTHFAWSSLVDWGNVGICRVEKDVGCLYVDGMKWY